MFIVTILIGVIGSYFAIRVKIPAGAMVGSLFFIAIFNIFKGEAYLPQNIKIITQIATGIFIGSKITLEDIKGLKETLFPAVLLVTFMAVFNFIMGFFIYLTTEIDIVTALFATAPGGITDISIISYDFGADSAKVAILQLIRMVSVVGILPFVIKFVVKKINKNIQDKNNSFENIKSKLEDKVSFNTVLKRTSITIFIGTIAGVIGLYSKIPAGAMSIAMIGTAFYNIFSNKAYIPLKLKQFIQILAGAFIGAQMTMKDIISLKEIAIPVIIVIIGFCSMNLIIGMFIYKITNFSIQTSLFSAAPGGISDMSIIAEELGADTPKVAVMQFCRLITVVAVYPILIKIISGFFMYI